LIPFATGVQAGEPHEALFWRKENGTAWAVRKGSQKLLQATEGTERKLYDLSRDIGENQDRAAEQPDQVTQLQRLYEDWDRLNQPPRFLGFRSYHQQKNAFYRSIDTSSDREE
jgi:hypothetical protein